FTPRVIEQLRPHIQQIVDGLLDRVEGERGMDLIEQFAYPLPVIVICEMLGVPVADHERFKGWGLDIARGLDAIMLPPDSPVAERSMHARHALGAYLRELIAAPRAAPRAARRPATPCSGGSSPRRKGGTSSARTSCSPPASCSSWPATRPP